MRVLRKLFGRRPAHGSAAIDLSDPALRELTDRIETHFELLLGGAFVAGNDGAHARRFLDESKATGEAPPPVRMSNASILYVVDFVFQTSAQLDIGGIEKAFPVASHLLARMTDEPVENWAPRIVDMLMIRDKIFKQLEACVDDPDAVRALTEETPLPILLAARAAAMTFVAQYDGGDISPSEEDIAAYAAICFPPEWQADRAAAEARGGDV